MVMDVAIIGSGISGLAAAYFLGHHYNITVYEKNDYAGGHSRTVHINAPDGPLSVDTGFIVFNKRNYPLLTKLFEQLNVPIAKSDMSFGVSINNGWLEYSTHSLVHTFAQARNLVRPPFWQMLADILRFNKSAKEFIESDDTLTLGQCLDQLSMGEWFRAYYILPMGGAIWSMPVQQTMNFPAKTFLRFFDNHGLLGLHDQPQWYTVKGGSKGYVDRLCAASEASIQLNSLVKKVSRSGEQWSIEASSGEIKKYDRVIFACHSDQILQMLDEPTDAQISILGNIRYQNNRMVLHRDVRFMPRRKKAWASWVYLSDDLKDRSGDMSLSYWMNNLQSLETTTPVIVTINPAHEPQSELIYDEFMFEHPVFDELAIKAQNRIDEIQGLDGLFYCGAWQRYGFHEDGLLSTVNMLAKIGIEVTWK